VTPEFSGLFSDTFFDERVGFLINGSYSKRNSREELANIDGCSRTSLLPVIARDQLQHQSRRAQLGAAQRGLGVVDHERSRTNGQAVLQFKPTDSVVATADYTYTYYKDIVNRHTFRRLVRLWPESHERDDQFHGTVTNLVDTGSDLSYFSAADQFINQNGSADSTCAGTHPTTWPSSSTAITPLPTRTAGLWATTTSVSLVKDCLSTPAGRQQESRCDQLNV